MKRKTIATLIIAIGSGGAYAADFVDTAQVVAATPVIERVSEPRQECDAAPAPQKDSNLAGPIIGGIVGGLLGHQVGHGRGQTAATIVGAAGGAAAGTVVANRAGAQPAQRCRTVESSREVIRGYDVVYRYNGRDVKTTLPYNPGRTVRVGVGVIDSGVSDSGRDSMPMSGIDSGAAANSASYPYRY